MTVKVSSPSVVNSLLKDGWYLEPISDRGSEHGGSYYILSRKESCLERRGGKNNPHSPSVSQTKESNPSPSVCHLQSPCSRFHKFHEHSERDCHQSDFLDPYFTPFLISKLNASQLIELTKKVNEILLKTEAVK